MFVDLNKTIFYRSYSEACVDYGHLLKSLSFRMLDLDNIENVNRMNATDQWKYAINQHCHAPFSIFLTLLNDSIEKR